MSQYQNNAEHDLHLRRIALGETEGELTGYPSKDKPWLKYYTEEYIKAPLPHMTAYAYLKTQNAARLDLIAIDSDMGTLTYGELFALIDQTAAALCACGVGKGSTILTMLPVLPQETFLFYGADAAGGVFYQLPPQYTVDEVCSAIRGTNAELFFVFAPLLTPAMEAAVYETACVRHIVLIGFGAAQHSDKRTLSWDAFLSFANEVCLPAVERDPSELLFLTGTGGSTGTPKMVMLSDNCFNLAVHQFLHSDLGYCEKDRWMRLWPIFSASAAVVNHHLPLCAGMHMLLRQFPMNMEDMASMILRDTPNHIILIPQLLDALEASEQLNGVDLHFIKTAGCGGIAITQQFEERVQDFFKEHHINTFLGYGWGCTENAASTSPRTNFATTVIGTAGAPLVKNTVSVFDPESGEELSFDSEGELCIQSPTLMLGYYNAPDMTAQVLKTHADGSVWLHTGDLGTVSKDGIVTVKGRMTRIIFVFPTAKVYPQALETALSKVQGVREVVICEIPDKEHSGFFLPICFVVRDEGFSAEEVFANIQDYCEQAFPEYSRPKAVYFKSAFPLTKVGKPDVRALEKEAAQKRTHNHQ